MKSHPKCCKISLICIVILALFAAAILNLYLHNFHTVIPATVYRSNELNQQQFTEVIHKFKIRSILNLRGAHPEVSWYDGEMAASNASRISHYDLALSAKIMPSNADLKKLVQLIDNSPRPLLIHCKQGADRTGLGSAIALLLDNASLEEAEKQASYRYFAISSASVGKQVLRRYKAWLEAQHLSSNRTNFLRWIASLNENTPQNIRKNHG